MIYAFDINNQFRLQVQAWVQVWLHFLIESEYLVPVTTRERNRETSQTIYHKSQMLSWKRENWQQTVIWSNNLSVCHVWVFVFSLSCQTQLCALCETRDPLFNEFNYRYWTRNCLMELGWDKLFQITRVYKNKLLTDR